MLLEEEVAGRDRSGAEGRLKAAGFPSGKTFEAWDEEAPSIPPPTQRALRTLEWIGRRENLAACGPSGTGKSHFLEALRHLAITRGMWVAWFSLESLESLGRWCVGTAPTTRWPERSHACSGPTSWWWTTSGWSRSARTRPRGSTDSSTRPTSVAQVAVTSNLHPAGWDELMPKTLATATVDRLLHHAHVVMTTGDSFRLAAATSGKGVVLLG